MKTLLKYILSGLLSVTLLSCAGQPVGSDEEFADDSVATDNSADEQTDGDSEVAAEDEEKSASNDEGEAVDEESSVGKQDTEGEDELENLDKDLDKEQKVAKGNDKFVDEDPMVEEIKKDNKPKEPQNDEKALTSEEKKESAPVVVEEQKDPLVEPAPTETAPVIANTPVEEQSQTTIGSSASTTVATGARNEINNIRFEGNEGAGSIIIEGSQPLDYSGRMNSQSNQYVIEIKNAHLPDRLKRPYITKDFPTSVGSIDAYQNPGSDVVSVVVQMREGASEPSSHVEGSSIIVVPTGGIVDTTTVAANQGSVGMSSNQGGILSSSNLEQFLSGNMKYYGKKISIEMKDIEVRNAISLIAEESGANLVMSESVGGNLALKLKNVPWDQALVLILKAKKLGYTRQGNVLRISPMSEIKQEEEDAAKLVQSRREIAPLKVQMIPINFAKTGDLKGQIDPMVTKGRGSVVADPRTNSLIITDTEEVLERAKKVIASLDIAPAQVLIEGKLVEARESFNKRLGIRWDVSGTQIGMGDGPNGPVNMSPSLSIRPGMASGGSLGFNLSLGTLDILGDLNAVLSLEEQEENVRVISSPRIVTLHNENATIDQTATVPVPTAVSKEGIKSYTNLSLSMRLNVKPEVANNGMVQLDVDISRQFLGAIKDDGSAGSHSRSAKTKVIVKSGQTAVIGGIYQNDASQLNSGVPFLRDIPILGFLFRSSSFHKDKTELLLFLTPRVLSRAGTAVVAQDMVPMSAPVDNQGEAPTATE